MTHSWPNLNICSYHNTKYVLCAAHTEVDDFQHYAIWGMCEKHVLRLKISVSNAVSMAVPNSRYLLLFFEALVFRFRHRHG